jgi:hypothetical protein
VEELRFERAIHIEGLYSVPIFAENGNLNFTLIMPNKGGEHSLKGSLMSLGNRHNQRIKVNRPEFDLGATGTQGSKREGMQLEKSIIRDDILWAAIVLEAEVRLLNIALHKYTLFI